MNPGVARGIPQARYLLLGATLFLAALGLLMIWSASSAQDFVRLSDSAYHVKRQAIFLAVGLAAMWFCSRLPASFVRRAGWYVLGAADAMLVLVLIIGVGKYGAVRALDLGFTTLQPAELAKVGCILVLADILADRVRRPRPITEDLGRILAAIVPPFLLIVVQPDMGAALSLLFAVFLVAVIGGLPGRYIVATVLALGASLPLLVLGKSYRALRFMSFLDPSKDPLGSGYQILQAKLAFGSGGLFGVGLGLSRQKFFYLPAAHTDFIFAIIGEELGLLGTLVVVGAFALLCWAGIRIALALKDTFARVVAGGLTVMIAVQAILNMCSVTGLIPVAGEPLPLVSFGGSSMLFTMGCIGLILAMTRGSASKATGGRAEKDEGTTRARTGERRGDGRPHLSGIDGGRAGHRRRA